MSKLQKKKTFAEKKKRKDGVEGGEVTVSATVAKPAAPASPIKPKQVSGEGAQPSGSLFVRAAEFLREVKVELKKVTWPTRKQTTGTTIVVILFVIAVAAFLGLFDFGLSKLVQVVLT